MLKRLVILNSAVYGKASIRLDDCSSIQLVGPNNIGKSTLIYTLNFLFIIDGKKMSFSGNRSEKETLHHYFPSPLNSYLIFEIFKQRYYSILVKRGIDGDLEYYRFDNEYDEGIFLENQEQQRVRKFEEVREILSARGIELYQFKNKSEVFNFIYQRGKRTNAAVWLENSVMSDGLSNNFSKVYRYLINSKLINNKTLKETLIIADSRDKDGINFSQKDKKDIANLLRANDELKTLESIKREFFEFREIVKQQRIKEKTVSELIFAYNNQYSYTKADLEFKVIEKKTLAERITNELNEELKPKQQKLNRNIGKIEGEIEQKHTLIAKNKSKLTEIENLEPIEFLKESLSNLDVKRKELETRLTRIETQKLSVFQINDKIVNLKEQIQNKKRQVDNFSNQLIHSISDSPEIKGNINYIISQDFLSTLTNSNVIKKIDSVSSIMQLFDGEISLHHELKSVPVASLSKLKEELEESEKELIEYQKLLPIAQDFEKTKQELRSVEISIQDYKNNIAKVESKLVVEETLAKLSKELNSLLESKDKLEREINILIEDIDRKTIAVNLLVEQKTEHESRIKEILEQKKFVESINVTPSEYDTTEGLDNLFRKIKLINKEREDLKNDKDRSFEKLKERVKSTVASEDEFIKNIEEEIACIPNKLTSIDGYLQAISVQFANPAASLLRRYSEFQEFIYNKFNSKLSKTKFSDIESLKIDLISNSNLIDDLKRISTIQDLKSNLEFDFGQSDNLKILNSWLDSSKRIDFDELFDIELKLIKGGKEKKVDLKNQVESDGTDRMIRLIIMMSVINRLAINDKENKIVVFVDEIATIDGQNRRELFKFCQSHNFIPICASPDETILDGFDKYILLFRPSRGGKVNVSEKQPNVIFQQKLVLHETN